MDVQSIRQRDFPSLTTMNYLNTAAEGIPPVAVVNAVQQYAQDKLLGMDGRELHEAQWQAAQEKLAQIYGLSPAEVSFCSCSSEAFNLAALAMRFQPGDEVVINDLDFPAGATPWLQPTCPAQTRLWRSRGGALHVDDLLPHLNDRTRLVTSSLVSFYNGFKLPLNDVIAAVREKSKALVAIDVTQALGRIPLDLSQVDLIVSSTHKWILAIHGGGLVGVPHRCAEQLTTHAGGWFHLESAFEADRFQRIRNRPGAMSFSVGMPNYAAVYAVRAALAYIQDLGVENIEAYARPLVERCLEGLAEADVELLTPNDPSKIAGILAFSHPKATEIHQRLHKQNIHVMSHAGRLRVAIHFYNTMDDIEDFLSSLRAALRSV